MLPALIIVGVAGLLCGLLLGLHIRHLSRVTVPRVTVPRVTAPRPTASAAAPIGGLPTIESSRSVIRTADDSLSDSASRLSQSSGKLESHWLDVQSRLAQHVQHLEARMAKVRIDELTGLPDRRAFDEDLCRRMAEWRRRGTPLCVLLLDIDRYREVNETLGREAANGLLRGIGLLLAASMREMDFMARFGREEFAVILPATCASEAMLAAKRLRAEAAAATLPIEGGLLSATLSIGLTETMLGDHATLLLERADAALHAAKRAGGNCVYFQTGAAARSIPAFEPDGFLRQSTDDESPDDASPSGNQPAPAESDCATLAV
jgi:diguanylate cyclase